MYQKLFITTGMCIGLSANYWVQFVNIIRAQVRFGSVPKNASPLIVAGFFIWSMTNLDLKFQRLVGDESPQNNKMEDCLWH